VGTGLRYSISRTSEHGAIGRMQSNAATGTSQVKSKGKAIPLQAWIGPEGSRRLRFPDFRDIRHRKVVSLTHWPPVLHRKYSWYSIMLEDESTPGPNCGLKDFVNETNGNRTFRLQSPVLSIRNASLTFNNSTFCPHRVFMCFVWISKQTTIISLYSVK